MLEINYLIDKKDIDDVIQELKEKKFYKDIKEYNITKIIFLIIYIIWIIIFFLSIYDNLSFILPIVCIFSIFSCTLQIRKLPKTIIEWKLLQHYTKKYLLTYTLKIDSNEIKSTSAIHFLNFKLKDIKEIDLLPNNLIIIDVKDNIIFIPKKVFKAYEEYKNTYDKILELKENTK